MRVIGGKGNGEDHDDPGAIVDAAVLAVEGDDLEAGQMAALAADFLTGGGGAGTIHQARLQEFLWSALPRKFPQPKWFPVADGAARLFDKLGLTRYAEVARSDTTRAVLETWGKDENVGFERFLLEHERSGVAPPKTELIEWGEMMAVDELVAFETVSVALEAALVEGGYHPGTSGWQRTAAEITRRTLTEQARPVRPADLRRFRLVDLALGSRVEPWIRAAANERHRALREAAAARFMDGPAAIAPEPPPDKLLQQAVAPMAWLLETCRDGARATSAGYLAPELVQEAVGRFGWSLFEERARSEVDVLPLRIIHEIATRNRWVLRRSKRIKTTKSAVALLDDPARLWWAVVGTAGQADEYSASISELMAMRLLEGPAQDIGLGGPSELALFVAEVIVAQGWRSGRTSITAHHVDRDVHGPLREWRDFRFLGDRPFSAEAFRSGRPTIALSPVGKHFAQALLYHRATAPGRLGGV